MPAVFRPLTCAAAALHFPRTGRQSLPLRHLRGKGGDVDLPDLGPHCKVRHLMNHRVIYPPLSEHYQLRQLLTAGEEMVLHLFNQHLPAGWEIYVQPHLNGLRPDLVLLNPNCGIAVFEVKDWDLGAMRYFTKKDQWGHTALFAERDGTEFQTDNPVSKVNL